MVVCNVGTITLLRRRPRIPNQQPPPIACKIRISKPRAFRGIKSRHQLRDTSFQRCSRKIFPIRIFAEGLLPIEGLWCDCRCLLVRPEDCPLSPGIFRASHKVFQIKLVGYGVSFISLFVTDGGDELGLDKEFGLRGPPTSESREAVACNLETIDCCEGGIYVAMPSGCRPAQGHPLLDKQRGGAV